MIQQENKKKILVFSSREICYMSSSFFAGQIGAAFEKLGFETEVCEFSKEDDLDRVLEPYIGTPYELIIDFNSMLPKVVMEDGTPYLDKLDGPFFDYILDHPLFHYNCLSCNVKNLHAIVLDEAQKRYVERYYTKVKSVSMLPLGATCALYQGEKRRDCRIFFPGSYDRPERVYEIIKVSPQPLRGMMEELVCRRLAEPLLPMEEAFHEYLMERDMELEDGQFALFMNAMYPVDAFVRDYFRKAALDELLKKKLPVTVIGEGWEKYSASEEANLCRERGVPFGLSFEKIAKEHILLNVSPIFNRGMHDRISAGMANHAVVLTDENPYLTTRFCNGKQICFYSLSDLETLSEQAGMLVEQEEVRRQIATRAYEEFTEHDTWICRAKAILSIAAATVAE